MSQSSVIAFGLLVGFIVYIVILGDFPKYRAILGF